LLSNNRLDKEVLIVENLVKVYKNSATPAVNGLSLSIFEGAAFGLLGPNGAGKTTAISVMTTLMKPTAGSVRVFGFNVENNPVQVREAIGLVPQDIALYEGLTARENLRYFGHMYGLKGTYLETRVSECLEFVGLTPSADQRVAKYSGGMKRRTNLAAGILHKPRLIFLDEPTAGIDPQSRGMLIERLFQLREEGVTMVYTTHYMEEAQSLCSSVAIMDEGRIIMQGPPSELMGNHPECSNLEDLFIMLTGKHLRD
jgi:ABC-2 type transport system ATP-binding protein